MKNMISYNQFGIWDDEVIMYDINNSNKINTDKTIKRDEKVNNNRIHGVESDNNKSARYYLMNIEKLAGCSCIKFKGQRNAGEPPSRWATVIHH